MFNADVAMLDFVKDPCMKYFCVDADLLGPALIPIEQSIFSTLSTSATKVSETLCHQQEEGRSSFQLLLSHQDRGQDLDSGSRTLESNRKKF